MTTQTVVFARSLNEKVVLSTTGRDAWIAGLFVGSDGTLLYSCNTTAASGQPVQVWASEGDMTDAPS